jgi:hypothetical protein
MGNQQSTDQQKTVTSDNQIVDRTLLSELYQACCDNDVELARALLETLPFESINGREVNGSTALHIAVENGHAEMVHLLLHEYDVFRHLTDRRGHTAYELVRTHEMRHLFARPSSYGNRFCTNEEQSTTFSIVLDNSKKSTFERVQRCNSFQVMWKHHANRAADNYECFRQLLYNHTPCHQWMNDTKSKQTAALLAIVEQHICSPTDQPKAKALLNQFFESGRAEPLIQLYTLGTSFYEHVNRSKELSEILTSAVCHAYRFPRERAFKGRSFRGILLTSKDIEVWQWAENNKDRFVVTNTFCSSSKDEGVARQFAGDKVIGHRRPVLMILEFEKECPLAIQLEKLSGELPCLSAFEQEEEVLILPKTTFIVTKVDISSPVTMIHLEHWDYDNIGEGSENLTIEAMFN